MQQRELGSNLAATRGPRVYRGGRESASGLPEFQRESKERLAGLLPQLIPLESHALCLGACPFSALSQSNDCLICGVFLVTDSAGFVISFNGRSGAVQPQDLTGVDRSVQAADVPQLIKRNLRERGAAAGGQHNEYEKQRGQAIVCRANHNQYSPTVSASAILQSAAHVR